MWNKWLFTVLSFFWILFFWYYTLVYSNFYKNNYINFLDVSFKNIYVNSDNLNSFMVYFNSTVDLSSYKIYSLCLNESSLFYSSENKYVFNVKILDKNCKNNNFYLQDNFWKILLNTHFNLNIISEFDLYNRYTDYSSEKLWKINKKIYSIKNKYKIFLNTDSKSENIDFIKKSMYYKELDYNQKIIENILFQRQFKYYIPVSGFKLPEKNINKLPNWARPYRATYTNWVHEWWDIDAPLWQEVSSIDSWIIIKVVRDFKFSDLSKLKKSGNLSYNDKVNNLDILRWNQVWLKTMKWDVIFYAHLDKIYDDIQVWNIIPRWYPLWTVWKTWIPDKDYDDYHLHFELRKNPYILSKAWKYSLYDYMNWDWYFKGESREYIKQKQYTIFEENYGKQFNYKK